MKRARSKLKNWTPENTILDEDSRTTSVPLSAVADLQGPEVKVIKAVCNVAEAHVRRHGYEGIRIDPMVELERIDDSVTASVSCVIRDDNRGLLGSHCAIVYGKLIRILRAGSEVVQKSIDLARDGILHHITSDAKKKEADGVIYHDDSLVVRFALNVLSIPGTGSVCLELDGESPLCVPLTVSGRPRMRDEDVEWLGAEVIELTKPTEQAMARVRPYGKRQSVRSVVYDDEHYETLLEAMRVDGAKWSIGLAAITNGGVVGSRKRRYRLLFIERSK